MNDLRVSPPRWEQLLAGAILFLSTNAVIPVVRQGGEVNTTNEADPLMQLLWTVGYLVTFVLIVTRCPWKDLVRAGRAWLVWLSIALVIVSAIWSPVPATTVQRGFAIAGTTAFGLYLGVRFPTRDIWRMLAWVLAITALVSVVFSIFLPVYGINHDERGTAWQGAFTTKGQLGRLMVVSAVLWLLFIRQNRRWLTLKLGLFAVSVALVVLSRSMTSLVVLLALLSFVPLFRIIRWHLSFVIPAVFTYGFIAAGAVTWTWTNFDDVANLLGRDPTLTGRTLLWSEVWEKIQVHPWLGYGYSGFWRGMEGPSGEIWLATGWDPPHAHNGYLDLWLQLGLVGLVALIAMLLAATARASRLARHTTGIDGEFPLLFFIFILLTNIAEVSILGRNSIYWVLFTAFYVQLVAARMPVAKLLPRHTRAPVLSAPATAAGALR